MPKPESAPLLFELNRLTVYRGDRRVLHDLALQVRLGEHLVLLGPNGCGKSTLIKTLTRELYPLETNIPGYCYKVLGEELVDITDIRRRLGIVELDQLQRLSHEVTVRSVTGLELVLSGFYGTMGLWPHLRPSAQKKRRARALMRFLEITHLAARPVAQMSSGEQRRALIARALVHDPAALILDEPTTSLDPGAVREFRQLLRKLARDGRAVLLVTHHIADVIPEIDRVVMVKDGRIVADGPKRELLTSARLSKLFGTRLRVTKNRGRYDVSVD